MDAQPFGVGVSALLAAVPILWLLAALALLRQAAWRACLIGLGATALIAALAWKIEWTDVLRAGLEGALLGLFPILFVIFAAIYTFNLTRETGAMDAMRRLLAGVTPDRRLQALLIAWGFGGFLEEQRASGPRWRSPRRSSSGWASSRAARRSCAWSPTRCPSPSAASGCRSSRSRGSPISTSRA